MSYKITVTASCGDSSQVKIVIRGGYHGKEVRLLDNGQTFESFIYGKKKITVFEMDKPVELPAAPAANAAG